VWCIVLPGDFGGGTVARHRRRALGLGHHLRAAFLLGSGKGKGIVGCHGRTVPTGWDGALRSLV